jgi:peptide/nickel transport system permease protein
MNATLGIVLPVGLAAALPLLGRRAAARAGLVRWRRFFEHPGAGLGLGIVAFFLLLALLAPALSPYRPSAQLDILALQHRPPSLPHPLGTDLLSRDVWSRVAFGARVSLGVGVLAALVAALMGTLVGTAAAVLGRRADAILMRLVDTGLAVPRVFLVLAALAVGHRLGAPGLALLIGFTGWFATSRIVRTEVRGLMTRPFVEAARGLGAGTSRLAWRHLLPNTAPLILVSLALGVADAMLVEAALSFLGVGIQPPAPSWGNMIAEARDYLIAAPWSSLFPGLALTSAVAGVHLVVDAARHCLDPRLAAQNAMHPTQTVVSQS